MDLIRYATIGGKKYPINTDFKIAIECDKIVNDPEIDDFERIIAVATLLFGDVPFEQFEEAQKKAVTFLSGGETGLKNQKRLIDFKQHWDLIYSAFLGQYGINLHDADLHYQEFTMLLRGIKDTALSDVIDILSKDPRDEKDYKSRKKLIEAQGKLRIKEVKQQAPENDAFLNQLASHVKGGVSDE